MAKKKTSKVITATDVLNVDGSFLPDLTAELFRFYYDAFVKQGFNSQQAYELARDVLRFYLCR
jgi:hypothetical protein